MVDLFIIDASGWFIYLNCIMMHGLANFKPQEAILAFSHTLIK
jgi:hypothetical protein